MNPGDRFGRLVAVRAFVQDGRTKWLCRCDCGKESVAEPRKLRSGHKSSCGCLRSNGPHMDRMTAAAAKQNRHDLIGLRFSRLVVIEEAARNRSGLLLFKCHCDCGNITEKTGRSLVSGDAKSCGCLRKEIVEQRAITRRLAAGLPEDQPMTPRNLAQRNLFRTLSAEVKRRDDFRCLLCDKRGVRLHVHHIEPWSTNQSLRFDRKNLVTLCHDCHINRAHGGNIHKQPDPVVKAILKRMTERNWICGDCGCLHDRDVNAALNILFRGYGHVAPAQGIPVL